MGRFANANPQDDILNAGMGSYSPSNYFLITHELLEEGVQVDEVLVLIDISDVQERMRKVHLPEPLAQRLVVGR